MKEKQTKPIKFALVLSSPCPGQGSMEYVNSRQDCEAHSVNAHAQLQHTSMCVVLQFYCLHKKDGQYLIADFYVVKLPTYTS